MVYLDFWFWYSVLVNYNNFRWLSQSPPCLHLPSKFERSLSESFQSFQRSPFWVLSYDGSPLLFSSKLSDPPTKILPPQAINNDWSLKCKYFSLQCLRPTKSQISSSSSNKKIGRRGAQIQKPYQKSMRFNHGISRRMDSLTINKNSQYGRYGYFMELCNKVQKLLLKFL